MYGSNQGSQHTSNDRVASLPMARRLSGSKALIGEELNSTPSPPYSAWVKATPMGGFAEGGLVFL